MFYYLEGQVSIIDQNTAVVDINGVGFKCYVTRNTLSYIEDGKRQRLYTYCNIKEDTFDIYGFSTPNEKRCFELLIGVSGVGPKAAQAILSVIAPENLALAIINEDDKMIATAQGVGKRTAQRVILELKDKIAKEMSGTIAAGAAAPDGGHMAGNVVSEAAAALTVLGYSSAEITNAMRSMETDGMTVEEIVKAVLKGSLA